MPLLKFHCRALLSGLYFLRCRPSGQRYQITLLYYPFAPLSRTNSPEQHEKTACTEGGGAEPVAETAAQAGGNMGLWLLLFRVGRPGCVLEHILQDITQMNRRGLQSGKQRARCMTKERSAEMSGRSSSSSTRPFCTRTTRRPKQRQRPVSGKTNSLSVSR